MKLRSPQGLCWAMGVGGAGGTPPTCPQAFTAAKYQMPRWAAGSRGWPVCDPCKAVVPQARLPVLPRLTQNRGGRLGWEVESSLVDREGTLFQNESQEEGKPPFNSWVPALLTLSCTVGTYCVRALWESPCRSAQPTATGVQWGPDTQTKLGHRLR